MLSLKDEEFNYIVSYMKSNFGINLEKKKPLIESRLSNHVQNLGYHNYMDYFMSTIKDKKTEEMLSLINKLTTNYTYFLRESDHFDFYKVKVLPWIDKTLKCKDLRIWSAGCSSGQEPYTLSMITHDYLGSGINDWESTILASDISNSVLCKAQAGVYADEDLSSIPDPWLKKYFVRSDPLHCEVASLIKKDVSFHNFNLLSDFNFKKPFHAIFCRNVMIYFDAQTKNDLINKFYRALQPGGYLFIGHSESLSSCKHNFKYVQPSIYQKRA